MLTPLPLSRLTRRNTCYTFSFFLSSSSSSSTSTTILSHLMLFSRSNEAQPTDHAAAAEQVSTKGDGRAERQQLHQ
jgi:hypothetical protein